MGKRIGKNTRLLEDIRVSALEKEDRARCCLGLVYLITNTLTGDRYVGATSQTLAMRWHWHKMDAFRFYKRTRLHTEMRQYGAAAFSVECLKTCMDLNMLASMERDEIDRLKPEYNLIIVPEDIWSGGFLKKLLESSAPIASKAAFAFLAASLLAAAPTFAADNFAINNATGTFTVIRCTESATVCTLNALVSQAAGAVDAISIAPIAGVTSVVSGSAEATHILKATPGVLYSVYATNLTATAGFLTILNATSAPADGAITPLDCVPLPANSFASINYRPGPTKTFSTGITAVITSAATCFTKTTGVITGFISGDVQ